MLYLIVSSGLRPGSNSRIMAIRALETLLARKVRAELLDLASTELPWCDGESCYEHAKVIEVTSRIESADGILLASPIYNYDLSGTAKNLLELTGKAWFRKVVGFLCAAGGQGSYMSPMGYANSLMLDFRCLILPRFVYARRKSFAGGQVADPKVGERIDELVSELITVTSSYRAS